MRLVEAEDLLRRIGTVAEAVPDLALLVLLAAEQDVPVAVGPGDQRDDRLRLGKAGQVVEIAVVPIRITASRGCAATSGAVGTSARPPPPCSRIVRSTASRRVAMDLVGVIHRDDRYGSRVRGVDYRTPRRARRPRMCATIDAMTAANAQARSSPVPALREAKRRLRESHRRPRATRCPREARARGVASRSRSALAALPSFARRARVLLTLPFRSEWDTRPLAARALAAGKTVVAPRVDRGARMLRLHRVADLERDIARAIAAFPSRAALPQRGGRDAIDWVLVPGVAFDAARAPPGLRRRLLRPAAAAAAARGAAHRGRVRRAGRRRGARRRRTISTRRLRRVTEQRTLDRAAAR